MTSIMKTFLSPTTSIIFLIIAVAVSTTTTTMAQQCTLECPEDAPCRFGHADFSGHSVELGEIHRFGMHCDCPVGWTGVLCDKKFDSCSNQQGHECYHGGRCIPGLEDKYGNDQLFCDCSAAHSNATGTRYVGKYCETPFEKVCNPDAAKDDQVFCVNGGDCNPDFPKSTSLPCLCDEGWEGYHCEFKTGTVPNCTLDCQNDGVCVVGAASPTDAEHMNHVWSLGEAEDHMRCFCPPGVGGALCEVPAEQCGSQGLCLHGGTCAVTTHTDDSGVTRTQHHCDCTTATDSEGLSYAGKYCEHKATMMCSDDDWNLFCTQGGTCRSNPIEGCDCPSGAAGYKCEFIIDNIGSNSTQDAVPDSGGDDDDDDDNDHVMPEDLLCASGVDGGKGYCQNGGICIEEEVVSEDGTRKTIESCDCSDAYTDKDIFDGPFCQYKATSLCLIGNESGPSSLQAFDRFCVNFGICQNDGSCECLPGWTGVHCERQKIDIYEQGKEDGPLCGDTRCLNGGTCVDTELRQPDGKVQYLTHCDCSTAFDESHLYAGESCQFPSTQLCTVMGDGESLRGSIFCTNHGTCNENVMLGCDCPVGFNGFACEFERQSDLVVDTNDDDGDDNWEICGDDGLVCHNGGECITTITNNKISGVMQTAYACDCSTAYDEKQAYLGLSCEYPSTAICEPQLEGEPLSAALFCVNEGICKEHPNKGCNCQDGFTGTFCQLKTEVKDIINGAANGEEVQYEKCGDDLVCLNGGECVTTMVVGSNGKLREVEHCDCTTAFTETDIYAGESCEYKATSICTAPNGDDIDGVQFCTNGGICKANHLEGCDCPLAWQGFHCEFASESSDLPTRNDDENGGGSNNANGCHLQCNNGGICANGAKDLGDLHDIIGDVQHLNSTFDKEYFAHCVCPEGWVGLTCDYKIEVCGEDGHVCLHGSKCVEVNGKNTCDCSEADQVVGDSEIPAFAGDSCQHAATDICTIGEDYPGKPLYFCVNSGICNAQVADDQPDPGCSCGQDWSGPHCESHISSSSAVASNEPTANGSNLGFIVGIVIGALVVILVILVVGPRIVAKKGSTKRDVSHNGTPFPRRRRRVNGFGGSPNLASTQGRRIDSRPTPPKDGIMLSSSDPMVAGFVLTPDDEPDSFDEGDGVMNSGTVLDETYSDDPNVDRDCPPTPDDGNVLDNVDFC